MTRRPDLAGAAPPQAAAAAAAGVGVGAALRDAAARERERRAGRIAVVVSTLKAEGGPVLAADLCASWAATGLAPRLIVLTSGTVEMLARFDALGVPVTFLDVASLSPRHYPRLLRRLLRTLRRDRPGGIVSIPSGVHGVVFAAAAAAGVRRRVVHVGTYPWHWDAANFWKYRLLMRLSAPLTTDLVTVTEHVRTGVEAHFGKVAGALHVIANGIDTDRFAPPVAAPAATSATSTSSATSATSAAPTLEPVRRAAVRRPGSIPMFAAHSGRETERIFPECALAPRPSANPSRAGAIAAPAPARAEMWLVHPPAEETVPSPPAAMSSRAVPHVRTEGDARLAPSPHEPARAVALRCDLAESPRADPAPAADRRAMQTADASSTVTGSAPRLATLLMVGRLDRTKDHRTLLGAVALLRWRYPVRLVIAGDGPLRPELEAEAHWLAIAADVDFLGARADIAALLAAADVFVFAAKPEEGLGIALLEAMAAGVPAVASDVGGCREVLAGGACGLLTPPGDAPAMADAVARLLADPALAAELAGRARARAVAVYGHHEMARRYAALLTPR